MMAEFLCGLNWLEGALRAFSDSRQDAGTLDSSSSCRKWDQLRGCNRINPFKTLRMCCIARKSNRRLREEDVSRQH